MSERNQTAKDSECVCGHPLELHSQLSTGCYAIPNMGCECSGYLSKHAYGIDDEVIELMAGNKVVMRIVNGVNETPEGRDPSTR